MVKSLVKLKITDISDFDKKKNLELPNYLTNQLAEFVGIHIGDGHMSFRKDKGMYIFRLCGHLIKDKLYYDKFLTPLLKKLFNLTLKPKDLRNGTCGYHFSSKGLFIFLTSNFCLPIGRKNPSIRIPKIIWNDKEFLISCLRGIIDTDFSISFDDTYPELGGWFATEKLVKDLERAFKLLKFDVRVRYNAGYLDKRTGKFYNRHHIRLRGKLNMERWHKIIGTHHPVLNTKYTYWRKGITLKDRDIIINPKIIKIAPN